ncbi:MAG: 1-acyl-sn-glycerol-3-phosphate acyltransferase [Desulfobacterota bacterium]|nr:1-acyl-sn-glycerol-3-phosphate acyltransferase [Thermodesulfobacteriota bacterium]
MERPEKIQDYFPYVAHRLKNKSYRREARLCTLLSRRLFSDIEVIGFDPLVRQRRAELEHGDHTVNIYIARHLSEFDWQELQRIFGEADMMATIQAGDNLFIGPLDPILRHYGGFKVFREEVRLFSPNWLAQLWFSMLDRLWQRKAIRKVLTALGMKRRQPLIVDQMLARDIYVAYLYHLIHEEGRDVLIFPEYTKTQDKKIKYGRSYSGRLLEFTPLVFKLLRDINKKTHRKIQIVPVHLSYERVVEDQTFRTLEKMKTNRVTKPFTYIVDYFFNYTHWLYQHHRGRLVIRFGEPIVLRKRMDFRLRLHEEVRKRVGMLQTVFPTQVLGYAFGDAQQLPENELIRRVEKTLQELRQTAADLRYVENLSPREIIAAAYPHFNMHRKRCALLYDPTNATYRVLRPDVISQYRNHILHLFEKWHVSDELRKFIDLFRDQPEKKSF